MLQIKCQFRPKCVELFDTTDGKVGPELECRFSFWSAYASCWLYQGARLVLASVLLVFPDPRFVVLPDMLLSSLDWNPASAVGEDPMSEHWKRLLCLLLLLPMVPWSVLTLMFDIVERSKSSAHNNS